MRILLGETHNWHEFAFHLHARVAGCAEKHARYADEQLNTDTTGYKANRRGEMTRFGGRKMRSLENASEDSLGRLEDSSGRR